MSNLLTFLTDLKAKRISVSLDDSLENLKVRGDLKNLSELDKDQLLKSKADLISFLKDQTSIAQAIEPVKRQASYPISNAQRRLWVLSQFEDSSVAYNMPNTVLLNQEIEIEKFKTAIISVIERHEILRTVFREDQAGEIRQWILKKEELEFKIGYTDLRTERDAQESVQRYINNDSHEPFDLAKGPLLRAGLFQLKNDEFVFYYNIHHIISDGWSMNVLAKDVISHYEAYMSNRQPELKDLKIQYKDYSAWQLALLASESFAGHRRYWLQKLSGELPLLDLPSAKQRPAIKTHNGGSVVAYLNEELTAKLRNYALQKEGTLFICITAALKALLHSYTGLEDIILGTPIAGRNHPELENQIGFYVNALVLRSKIGERDSFEKIYQTVRHTILEAYDHQMYPFDRLVEDLGQNRQTSRSAVFDVMIALENIGEKAGYLPIEKNKIDDITESENKTCKYDLEFGFQEVGSSLRLVIDYNKDIYNTNKIIGIVGHFKKLVSFIMAEPDRRISAINLLREEQKQLSVLQAETSDKKGKTIIELFHDQMRRPVPGSSMFFSGPGGTYEELDKRSNQVAQFLCRQIKIKKEEVVGLLLDHGRDNMICMLGVLKSGGAYLLLDKEISEDRLLFMISDAGVRILITAKEQLELADKLQWSSDCLEHYMCIDSDDIKSYPDNYNHISMIQEMWDHVGEEAKDQITGGGWQSSYTGQAISVDEMEEYSMNAYKKLKNHLHPNARVLEIGCSSGLTLSKIAPEVGLYYGTDLSPVIISRTKRMVTEKGLLNVKLRQMAAHELPLLEEKGFDLIVINSVIQDFQSHSYLRGVIKDCISLLGEQGQIFIGDVMDLNKKKSLMEELDIFTRENRNNGYTTKKDFSTDLFVSRGFFEDLAVDEKTITGVTVSEKIRTIENELTKYRYDVLLHIDKSSRGYIAVNNRHNKEKKKWQYGLSFLDRQQATDPGIKIVSGQLACIDYGSITRGIKRSILEHGDMVEFFNTDAPPVKFNTDYTWRKHFTFAIDSSVWHQARLREDKLVNDRNFWLSKLSGELPMLNLPASKTLKFKSDNGRRLRAYIDHVLNFKLKEFSNENEGDIYIGLLTVWNILMYRYTSQKDIITGAIADSRSYPDPKMCGFYINTLALRSTVDPDESAREFFRKVKDNVEECFNHQAYPFDRLLEELNLTGDTDKSPIEAVFVFQGKGQKMMGVDPERDPDRITDCGPCLPKFNINVLIQETEEYLSFDLIYNESVYDRETIEGLMKHYKQLLNELLDNPDKRLSQLDYLSEEEKRELLVTFNNGRVDCSKDKTVVNLFEDQVIETPEDTAIVFRERELSYKQLDELSNRLAHYLQDNYAIGPGDIVGINQEKSERMIISVLAVLKAGAAYAPIDPDYPQERVDYIAKDTAYKVCLDKNELHKFEQAEKAYPVGKVRSGLQPSDPAYVIYTSGSTGTPKGVVVTHGNLVNKLFEERTVLFTDDRITSYCLTNYVFDVSLLEMIFPLSIGGRVIVPAPETLNSFSAIAWDIIKSKVNLLQATPVYLQQFISSLEVKDADALNRSLRVVCIGGESLDANLVFEVKNRLPDVVLNNHYGPTEITIDAIVNQDIRSFEFNVIGKPLGNTRIYVLDEYQKLVPPNVVGEIVISGPSVSPGYLGQVELNQKKFIDNPFEKGAKVYRTGDFGRWSKKGEIEFFGRKDDQIKVRGYRIELEEIEAAIKRQAQIKSAVVLVKTVSGSDRNTENGKRHTEDKILVAYITAGDQYDPIQLRSDLKNVLPIYMIPAYFIQLEELPLSANGKIDRKALPDPEEISPKSEATYVAPGNQMEERLVRIWENVLQRESIGIKDDFFSLGGHSLKAVKLSNEYQKEFSVKLSLKELFAHTTITSHVELIGSSKKVEFTQIEKSAQQESFPMSDAQRRLWILSQFEHGSAAYNMPSYVRLNGRYEIKSFERAIHSVIDRHEILRTVFREDGEGGLRQWILKKEDLGFRFDHKDFRKETNKEESVKSYIAEDSYKPFDLANGPLLRSALLRTDNEAYVFYYNMHHIISDGWSMEVLFRDVLLYYKAYKENKEPELKPLRIQYKDYSVWQLEQLKKASVKTHRQYWLDSLKGDLPSLDLPGRQPRPKMKTNKGRSLNTYLDPVITGRLRKYSEEKGGSLFIGLLAAWNVLMYRYTSQTDIITGTSVAAREHADLDDQIGFYSNTLALRNEINPDESFDAFYTTVRDNTLKSYQHQMYPFIRVAEDLNYNRDRSRHMVFDIMLFLDNNSERASEINLESAGLKEEELNRITDLGDSPSKFDINVSLKEEGGYLSLQVVYDTDVYDKPMVEGLICHYKQLIRALLDHPEEKVSRIDYLSPEERRRLLHDFNAGMVEYPREKTIVELFEEQVDRTPDHAAVVFKNKKLSYRELDDLSNKLAHHLRENYNVGADDLIGIQLDRSEWLIVSVLGILKAGAAYVPVDPEDPAFRKEHILKDASLKVLITEVNFVHEMDYYQGELFAIDVEFDAGSYSSEKLQRSGSPSDLAYVIYTSGSTGKPKGVMITSGSIVDYVYGVLNETNMQECRSFGLVSTISADLGNTVIYTSLLVGASLHILDKKDIAHAGRLMSHNLDCIKMTPSHWKALQGEQSFFAPNKCLILGGEQFPQDIADRIKLNDWPCEVFNHYGPTETTIGKLIRHIDKNDDFVLSLGKPMGDNQVYILNPAQQLCPVGVTGEICISGAGLARGYLNREDLTREKFVSHPFKAGERLYRTGDLGRWLADGNVEFLGRRDEQVKIRGYRIELGEIEHALRSHKEVKEAVVIARENRSGEKELVAYVAGIAELPAADLRSYLKEVLPEYMLPAHYIQLEALPLTSNGKINKRALPDPEGAGFSGGAEYVAARNETENKIIETIADIVGKPKDRIGVYDNFFDLGLSSLGLIKLYTSINKDLRSNLNAVSVFEFSNVAALAAYILNGAEADSAVLNEEGISGAMDEMIDLM